MEKTPNESKGMHAYAALYEVILATVCEAQETGWRTVTGPLLPPTAQGCTAAIPAPVGIVKDRRQAGVQSQALLPPTAQGCTAAIPAPVGIVKDRRRAGVQSQAPSSHQLIKAALLPFLHQWA